MSEIYVDEYGRRLNGGPKAQRSVEIDKAVYEDGAVPDKKELTDNEELYKIENKSSDREIRADADS